jgi:hypothetical protein
MERFGRFTVLAIHTLCVMRTHYVKKILLAKDMHLNTM